MPTVRSDSRNVLLSSLLFSSIFTYCLRTKIDMFFSIVDLPLRETLIRLLCESVDSQHHQGWISCIETLRLLLIRNQSPSWFSCEADPFSRRKWTSCPTDPHGPQVVSPHPLKNCVLFMNRYPVLIDYPGGRNIYQRIRQHLYWPDIFTDCCVPIRNCPKWALRGLKHRKMWWSWNCSSS